jgi:hypothetical protein
MKQLSLIVSSMTGYLDAASGKLAGCFRQPSDRRRLEFNLLFLNNKFTKFGVRSKAKRRYVSCCELGNLGVASISQVARCSSEPTWAQSLAHDSRDHDRAQHRPGSPGAGWLVRMFLGSGVRIAAHALLRCSCISYLGPGGSVEEPVALSRCNSSRNAVARPHSRVAASAVIAIEEVS